MGEEVAIRAGTRVLELPGATVTVTAPRDVSAEEMARAFAGLEGGIDGRSDESVAGADAA